MKSTVHLAHIHSQISYNNCRECNADRERRFTCSRWLGYHLVHEYIIFVRYGFSGKGVRTWWGGRYLIKEEWGREFRRALHERIYLRRAPPCWRKLSSGYIERLKQFRGVTVDAAYLRKFAATGASTLQ